MMCLGDVEAKAWMDDSVPREYINLLTGKDLTVDEAKKLVKDNIKKVNVDIQEVSEEGTVFFITVKGDTNNMFSILMDLVFIATGIKETWFYKIDNLMECVYLSEEISETSEIYNKLDTIYKRI